METDDQLDAVFFALSDRRRRHLLAELAAGPRAISVLAATQDLTLSATSKHIAALEAADLLFKMRRGREVYCHLNFDVWRKVAGYIAMHAKFWAGRLDELEQHLKDAGAD
jgi:DNA-binding transcriptional ArsR family regulator